MQKCPGFGAPFFFSGFNPKGVPVSFSIIAAYADAGDTLLADIAALMVISGVMAFGATSTWALVGSGNFPIVEFPTRIGDLQRRNGRTACAVANSGVFINDPQNVR